MYEGRGVTQEGQAFGSTAAAGSKNYKHLQQLHSVHKLTFAKDQITEVYFMKSQYIADNVFESTLKREGRKENMFS